MPKTCGSGVEFGLDFVFFCFLSLSLSLSVPFLGVAGGGGGVGFGFRGLGFIALCAPHFCPAGFARNKPRLGKYWVIAGQAYTTEARGKIRK